VRRDWQEAAERGDASTLTRLLDLGENVNSLDRFGQTALMLASRNGHTEAVRVLLESGADLDCTAKYHLSALMLAVINDHFSIVWHLVQAGANTQIRGTGAPGFADKTAGDLAEDLGRESILELLRSR
jgi:ankyrin repeat protein